VLLRAATNFHRQVAMDIAWAMRRKSRRTHLAMEGGKNQKRNLINSNLMIHHRTRCDTDVSKLCLAVTDISATRALALISQYLRPGTFKIKTGISCFRANIHSKLDGPAIDKIINRTRSGSVYSSKAFQQLTDSHFSVILDEVHVGLDILYPIFTNKTLQ